MNFPFTLDEGQHTCGFSDMDPEDCSACGLAYDDEPVAAQPAGLGWVFHNDPEGDAEHYARLDAEAEARDAEDWDILMGLD
jgi:hypothetical protein